MGLESTEEVDSIVGLDVSIEPDDGKHGIISGIGVGYEGAEKVY